jgi:hypothetical protein
MDSDADLFVDLAAGRGDYTFAGLDAPTDAGPFTHAKAALFQPQQHGIRRIAAQQEAQRGIWHSRCWLGLRLRGLRHVMAL